MCADLEHGEGHGGPHDHVLAAGTRPDLCQVLLVVTVSVLGEQLAEVGGVL